MGRSLEWNDMSRGAEHWVEGADAEAEKIGLKPLLSGVKTEDEGLTVLRWLLAGKNTRSHRKQISKRQQVSTRLPCRKPVRLLAREPATDDRDWDNWLALYDEKCTFWVPAWTMTAN